MSVFYALEPVNVTLYGKRHFMDMIKLKVWKVCGALNVTVSPGPVVDYLEGENATLLCHVSQKRRKDSLLAVRWFFARPDSQEALMVKMTKLRVVQYYGNYSRSAYRRRLRLLEERRGALYTLSVLTLGPADQGHYVCKVQEISKHRNKWTAWSNGSSATEMRGRGPQRSSAGLERIFLAPVGHHRINQAVGMGIDRYVDAGADL
nr:PREDICTED: V-set and transmembrane domain-containing protein 4 [Equus przewalskii]